MKSISIIIPCRNEERFIRTCLDSLLAQNYPKEKMEILVVDGASTDKTRDVVREYIEKDNRVKLLYNPRKITPVAMNIGIKVANGDFVTKSDAHTFYPPDYVKKCVKYIEEYNADAVGGITKTLQGIPTLTANAIALSLGSRFGTGGSRFRTGSDKPKFVDTAFGICYRKDVFKKVGLFNEKLARSQDMDFNLRLKKSGGKILLAPDIELIYFPKSTIKAFFVHNVSDGIWAILPTKFGAPIFSLRHLAPLGFIIYLAGTFLVGIFIPLVMYVFIFSLVFYLMTSLTVSLLLAVKKKNLLLTPALVAVFAARHFGYGIGSLIGLARLI